MNLLPHIPDLSEISRSLGFVADPTEVKQVKWQDYSNVVKIMGNENLFICKIPRDLDEDLEYEVILHDKNNKNNVNAYSLRRLENLDGFDKITRPFEEIIVPLIKFAPEMYNLESISKLCDVLRCNPGWHLANMAVQTEKTKLLDIPEIQKFINTPAKGDGKYPIHVATDINSVPMIRKLIELKASVEVLDIHKRNVLHYAATKDTNILEEFSDLLSETSINALDEHGFSPTMLAVLARRPLNLVFLIRQRHIYEDKKRGEAYRERKALQAVKHMTYDEKAVREGGNILHWVRKESDILQILDLGFDINSVNDKKQTPLHLMAIDSNLECTMALLGRNCDPDIQDLDGNTALHYAARNMNTYICIALITFGADSNILNDAGISPRHLIASKELSDNDEHQQRNNLLHVMHNLGATRCLKEFHACQPGCAPYGHYNGNPSGITYVHKRCRWLIDESISKFQIDSSIKDLLTKHPDRIGKGRILCLDGGGMKGLASTQMLSVIEKSLGKPIHECFDLIAGTSIGGFLALMIANGLSWKDAQHMLCSLRTKVFVGSKPYDAGILEKILKDIFGCDSKMSDIKGRKVILHATAADRSPAELHKFRNYDDAAIILSMEEGDNYSKNPTPDYPIWEAAIASGAAPTFFRPHKNYLDGAFFSNNPVIDVLTEIEELNAALKIKNREKEIFVPSVIVSVGCSQPSLKKVEHLDPMSMNFYSATYNLINIAVENCSATDGPVADRSRAWCASRNIPYFRFNPVVLNMPELNETKAELLLDLMWETRSYMEKNIDLVNKMKDVICPEK